MNPIQKKLLKLFGGPVPVDLARSNKPLSLNDLNGHRAAVFSFAESSAAGVIEQTLSDAGIEQISSAALSEQTQRVNALILDVTGLDELRDFDALYTALNAHVGQLAKSGRIVIVTDASQGSHLQNAVVPALEGFMRALSKEVGRLGATVNLIHIKENAHERAGAVLRFILSVRSAFIDAQTFTVTETVKDSSAPVHSAPLAGKQIIVTGAARGIGLALAQTLAREGAKVIGVDVPNNPALKKEMDKLGGIAFELNVAADDAPDALCQFLKNNTGAVDCVIHNAGVTRDKTIKRMSGQFWDLVMAINLNAPMRLTQALLDNDLIYKGGRIIGLASISGIAGNPGQTNYALTKGGLAGYMASLSNELAEKGIAVNTVAPGFIETEMTAQIPFMVREVGRMFNSLKQGGLPEDVADLITFLSSANSVGITGHNIRICGHNLLGK